jgi:hypothetical protein
MDRNRIARRCGEVQKSHRSAHAGDSRHMDNLKMIQQWFRSGCPSEQMKVVRGIFWRIKDNWYGRPYMFAIRGAFDQLDLAFDGTNPDVQNMERLWASILHYRRQHFEKVNAK